MKLSLSHLLAAAVVIDLAALVVSFALRHAKHGAGETIGAIGWFTLLADTLILLALAAAALARVLRSRQVTRPAAH